MFGIGKNHILIGSVTILVGIIVTMGISNKLLDIKNRNLKIDVSNGVEAIIAYEQILKVVPFEALGGEWKDRANEEINTTLSNTDNVVDNTYKL